MVYGKRVTAECQGWEIIVILQEQGEISPEANDLLNERIDGGGLQEVKC